MATPRPARRFENTPVPSLLPNSRDVMSGEMATLASFTTSRLLPLPPLSQPLALLGQGVLRFAPTDPSWSVSENSDGYQGAYLRLLSKFVR